VFVLLFLSVKTRFCPRLSIATLSAPIKVAFVLLLAAPLICAAQTAPVITSPDTATGAVGATFTHQVTDSSVPAGKKAGT
jgi:hypothetical protein